MSRAGLAIAICLAVGFAAPARADWFANECGPLDERTARVIERFEQEVATRGAGIAVGVVRGDCMLWQGGFGLADRERGVAMEPATMSRIGSVTKTFTSVLLLKLVEHGIVSLDDPVVRHLPEFAQVRGARVPRVTLRHLASHTSGLPVKRDPDGAVGPFAAWQRNALRSLTRTELVFRPGNRYRYSNLGTVALGLALERAAATPYVDLVKQHILEPLGMQRTTFFVPPEQRSAPNLALSPFGAHEHDGRGNRVPSGFLYSTVADLGRFAAALYGAGPADFLSDDSRRAQTTTPRDSKYGLGVRMGRVAGRPALQHAGAIPGYRAAFVVVPKAQMGVIVLQASGHGRPRPMELAHRLLRPLVAQRTAD